MTLGAVKIDRFLDLEICSIELGKSLTIRLSRLSAQHLADALLDYSGNTSKSLHSTKTLIAGTDLSAGVGVTKDAPGPVKVPHGAVYLRGK